MFRLLFLFWLSFHPVHVSLTSLDYMQDKGSFRGFVRIYMDDLLLDCGCGLQQDKLTVGEKSSVDVLEKYLNERIIVTVNGKAVTGEIGNVGISDNEVDVDLQYKSRKPETLTVKCLIMTGLYYDQSNMVIVKVNDFEQGVKLTPEITEQTFKVN